MSTYLTIALILLALIAVLIVTLRNKSRSRTQVYVCRHCGEHHCDCQLEENGQ